MLTTRRNRDRVANGLARALRTAQDTTPGFTAAIRPRARELINAHAEIAAIERRLRSPEPIPAHGIAMLRELLSDPASPLYQPTEPGALVNLLRATHAALKPNPPPQ